MWKVLVPAFVLAAVVACSNYTEADVNGINDAWDAQPQPGNPNLWDVGCKDGTHEVRTSDELKDDHACGLYEKFVTKQQTVLHIDYWQGGNNKTDPVPLPLPTPQDSQPLPAPTPHFQGNDSSANCILPAGSVVRTFTPCSGFCAPSQTRPTIRDGRYLIEGGVAIDSAIANECARLLASTWPAQVSLFAAHVDYREDTSPTSTATSTSIGTATTTSIGTATDTSTDISH